MDSPPARRRSRWWPWLAVAAVLALCSPCLYGFAAAAVSRSQAGDLLDDLSLPASWRVRGSDKHEQPDFGQERYASRTRIFEARGATDEVTATVREAAADAGWQPDQQSGGSSLASCSDYTACWRKDGETGLFFDGRAGVVTLTVTYVPWYARQLGY
ncbi:hypothetical protein [Actinoplanes rectilineatus]|uniref:hypothetical protein n=1 Tax=Actinoplanes rectilineatus TaxID=113571 RepID=UPI000AC4D3A9|nr:hypothetical protein [Actinoplanes rectilineatus]